MSCNRCSFWMIKSSLPPSTCTQHEHTSNMSNMTHLAIAMICAITHILPHRNHASWACRNGGCQQRLLPTLQLGILLAVQETQSQKEGTMDQTNPAPAPVGSGHHHVWPCISIGGWGYHHGWMGIIMGGWVSSWVAGYHHGWMGIIIAFLWDYFKRRWWSWLLLPP